MGTERIEVETPSGTAWIDIDRPEQPARAVVALGHGAGGGVTAPDLMAVRSAGLAAGFVIARITQPYRVAGRRSPAPAPRLDEAWIAVTEQLRAAVVPPLPLIQGGRSSGARVVCRTASLTGAVGVVALAFPVHPPGNPAKSRLDELRGAGVPVLVVQGDRDAFGMPPADAAARLIVVEGADHSMKKAPALIGGSAVDFVNDLLDGVLRS